MAKKRKYLIETSAVPAALGESTPAHCERFLETTEDGTLWTSSYIRKEFVRLWIAYCIRMAFLVDQFNDVASALYYLEQDFGRGAKTGMHTLARFLQNKEGITNRKALAKELAHDAIVNLRKFDHRFPNRTKNSCGCRIGGRRLKVDFNRLFEDLRSFLDSIGVVHDCPVNSFLGLSTSGRARRLLAQPDVVEKTKSGKKLAKLCDAGKHITCKECGTIGDAIIALEQPAWTCLVHIDKDFCTLCGAMNREHKPLPALRAVEKDGLDP